MPTLLFACLGIFAVSFLPQLPSVWIGLPLFVLSVCFLSGKKFAVAALLVGFLYGLWNGYKIMDQQLPLEFEGKSFWIVARVINLPKADHKSQRFYVELKAIEPVDKNIQPDSLEPLIGKHVALTWYVSYYSNTTENSFTEFVQPGDTWRLLVKLKRPRGFVNPAGFDYQLYLMQQGISASGYVKTNRVKTNSVKTKTSGGNQLLKRQCLPLNVDCVRYELSKAISEHLSHHSQLGPLLGLVVGNRQYISQEQWQLLRNTGTIHLMAISGLHIGLAAVIGMLLGKFIVRIVICCSRSSIITSTFVQIFPSILSIGFAWIYSLLAGFSLPTQRAMIMVFAFQVFFIMRRKVSPWLILTLALFGIALLDPLATRSQGFWLSFLAVSVLMFTGNGYQQIKASSAFRFLSNGVEFVKVQWTLVLGLIIPGIILVQGVSLSSPFCNLLAIPVVSLITVPLSFMALGLWCVYEQGGLWFFQLAADSLQWLWQLLEFGERFFGGFWNYGFRDLSIFKLLLSAVGILWFFLPKGVPFRWFGLLCVVPLFFAPQQHFDLRLTFLDVGQGTAIVVETANHQLVYDVGRHYSEQFDTGQHIVAPYLIQQGYKEIDKLIISHGDSDHAGGMSGLLSQVETNTLYSGEPEKTGGQQCMAGQEWQWDQVQFSVIWPTEKFLESTIETKSNNQSCVILIRYRDKTLLLAGDIEKLVEQQLLASDNVPKSLSLLLVPHHGSRTSSHPAWVRHLSPKFAVVTSGYMNPYRHPYKKVVDRYQEYAEQIFNTADSGAIRFTYDQQQRLVVEQWRKRYSRFWY
jgi:competence protein ComEC